MCRAEDLSLKSLELEWSEPLPLVPSGSPKLIAFLATNLVRIPQRSFPRSYPRAAEASTAVEPVRVRNPKHGVDRASGQSQDREHRAGQLPTR
jgi:hypothetical protein